MESSALSCLKSMPALEHGLWGRVSLCRSVEWHNVPGMWGVCTCACFKVVC